MKPTFKTFRNIEQQDSSPYNRGGFGGVSSGMQLLPSNQKFATFGIVVLIYNLLAVAWGVFVRAGKYGDGCGSHWPLCDGDHTPFNGDMARWVEMSHRISTSLCGVLAIAMTVWAVRTFAKGHPARQATWVVLGLTLLEGLIGAALVKFKLVVENDSTARAGVMMFHVVSTFLLVGAIAAAAVFATGVRPVKWKGQGIVFWILGVAAAGLILLGMSGAISALGHQLRPTENVLKEALKPTSFWMVQVQPLHPLMSVSVSLYLALAAGLVQHCRPDAKVKLAYKWILALLGTQLVIGSLNIWLKAPIPMQMVHLVLADLNWVSLVVMSIYALGQGIESVEYRPAPTEAVAEGPLKGRELIKAYVALTKPRVISLLLFTTLTSMVAAKGEWPGTFLFIIVGIAGYMAAGAANAINMVIDRDIDLTMKRTASRPTVTQSIPSTHALIFAFTLATLSFGLLWGFANLLSAVMAFSGLVFYVIIYTLMLKRRTWHNIVIGGAAGAFPPLVGWAAVTNELPPLALYLFAIIFVWTPVHFWALALLLKDDYAAAGVPMLPVVRSERFTLVQIGIYTVVTIAMTFVPLFLPQVGWIYGATALVLNIFLVRLFWKLWNQIDRPRASALFHYSMAYLAILFLMFAIDRAVVRSISG